MVLEKNLAQLTQMYHQLINQRAQLKLDVQMKDKQLLRKTKKCDDNDKQVGTLKEDCKLYRVQCDELKEIIKKRVPDCEAILAQPIFSQAAPIYSSQANVVKPLRGGGGTSSLLILK